MKLKGNWIFNCKGLIIIFRILKKYLEKVIFYFI